jgi:Leucine-rich repeat (LRR) protein
MTNILVQSPLETLEPAFTRQSLVSGVFAAALEAVPADDWGRTWADNRTIMLRMTSKQIKEIIDKMRLPVVVLLNMSFWNKICNGTASVSEGDCTFNEKLQLVTRHLGVLATTCQITRLELPCNMNIHCYLERLKEALDQCKSLTNLNLYNNNLGAAGIERLAGVLGQCSVLKLAHNNIGTEGANSLVGVLTQCTHLNLCNNNIGTAGLESIEKCKTLTRLTYLNLCYNQIDAVRIDRILSQNTGLTHLDLSQNLINTLSIGTMTKCFALTYFNLSYNHIDAEGATSLVGVLRQCPSLTELNLAHNYIGSEGATSLTEALGQCTALSKLYLASNDIGDVGIERLIEVLSQSNNLALSYLTLSGNGIDEDRANNLAGVLGHGVKLIC